MAKRPKRKNLKPSGRCIFCGSEHLSKEHVWSDWLNQFLPPVSHRQVQIGGGYSKIPLSKPTRKGGGTSRRSQGSPFGVKVKIVCVKCNSGWMSRIVERAKPIIIPLLRGESSVLSPAQQMYLSAWIALCCITAEYLPGNDRVIPASHRRWLMRKVSPPEEWSICIGQFSGSVPFMYQHRAYFLRSGGEILGSVIERVTAELEWPTRDNSQNSTFVLGNFLIHTFTTLESSRMSVAFEKWVDATILTRIWPPQRLFCPLPIKTLRWPPPQALDDKATNAITDAFYLYMSEPKSL